MMDNAPITGGCHYPWDCKGFTSDCSNCPAIVDKKHFGEASENLEIKQKTLPIDLTFVTFSEQDYQRAISSKVGLRRKVIKRLGFVEEDKYKPGDKSSAKSHFKISAERKVIFFGASKMNEKRKGMDLLIDALMHLQDYLLANQVVLMCSGLQVPEMDNLVLNHVGFLNEDELILAYRAADIFVCPSIEDSGPMMINQSLMCGTPVVAFETGIAIDLVINGQTGYVAEKNDFVDLAEGIKRMLELSPTEYLFYSEKCREIGIASSGSTAFQKFCDEILLPD